MPRHHTTRRHLGALALGVAALLFMVFPLIRPFFPLDPTAPAATLTVASPVLTSAPWVVSHLLCTCAFVLLLYGMQTLHVCLMPSQAEGRALRAMGVGVAGIALILPMLGVETFMLPIIGKLYLEGHTAIAPAVRMIYLGPAMVVFLLGLVLLAVGAIGFARAIWQSAVLPKWAGIVWATGLTLWFPPFPRPVRIVDGLLIGIGGAWLAWDLWRTAAACPVLQWSNNPMELQGE